MKKIKPHPNANLIKSIMAEKIKTINAITKKTVILYDLKSTIY